jgi:hypothetical protein
MGRKGIELATEYPPATRGKIVVWGLMASLPFGGMIWQALHYLVGLRRLGFDVWYVEDSDRVVYDPVKFWPTLKYADNLVHLHRNMKSVGLGDRWVFRPPDVWDTCLGATDLAGLSRLYREADAAINLCGAQEMRAEHRNIRHLIYVQTDPTADQVRIANGKRPKIEELEAYDALFTYGENIGTAACRIPVERFQWHTTRPPVLLDWWRDTGPPSPDAKLTTIMNWKRFPKKAVTWKGETWSWDKQDEVRRFIDLPTRSALPIELALGGYVSDEDRALLIGSGWQVRSAAELADPHAYRTYIQESRGELTIAKEQYVIPRSGWFSDRSVCYLAAGRPVIIQNTGLGRTIPTGEGLFAFDDEEEALAGIEEVAGDYPRHALAARELAREYFAGDVVLTDMLAKAGMTS